MFASRGFIHDDLLCTKMNKNTGKNTLRILLSDHAMLPTKNKIIIWELEF